MYHAWKPLEFSRVNGYLYPHVSNFTNVMLVLPATSIFSKRVFYTAGNIISGQRECLLLRNANMLILIKHNKAFDDNKLFSNKY